MHTHDRIAEPSIAFGHPRRTCVAMGRKDLGGA